MAVRDKGRDLAAVGAAKQSPFSSVVVSPDSSKFGSSCSPELGTRQATRLLQTDFRSSSQTTNKVVQHVLQESAAFGLEGFYNSGSHNDFFLGTSHSLQTTMECPSEIRMDGLKEEDQRGEMQTSSTLPSLQLRSPLPGDTPSPYGTYNGLSLQTGSSCDGAVSLQAAVGNNTSGKFSHDSSEHPLPDMPTSSSSAAGPVNSYLSPIITHEGISNMNSSTVLLADMVSSPYVNMPSEDAVDIDMEEESGDTHVTCLWAGCLQEFSSLTQLVIHLDRCHTLSMTQYVCLWENCPRQLKPFDARYKLTTHLRCHTGEKPYQCEVTLCKRSFSRLENLKLHTRTHTGEKPYQCHHTGCTKRFNNTSDRAKHMKTHITRKPYACKHPGCNKSYTDPSSMRKHIKYTHKLKEEVEEGGLSLASLPRRKRNSTSCSSSSSSSSTPHTPQQSAQTHQLLQGAVLLHSPPAVPLEDTPKSVLIAPPTQSTPVSVHSQNGYPTLNTSNAPQIIPMVQFPGSTGKVTGPNGPSLLVPAYQQSSVMMILPGNYSQASTSIGSTFSSATAMPTSLVPVSTVPHQASSQQSHIPPIPLATPAQVLSTTLAPPAMQQSHKNCVASTSTSSLSVEDQLRLQIVQLRQQLYQSQLAAAAAAGALPMETMSSPALDSTHPVVFLHNNKMNALLEVGGEKVKVSTTISQSKDISSVYKVTNKLSRDCILPETKAGPQLTPKPVSAVQQLPSSSVPVSLLNASGRNAGGGQGPIFLPANYIPVLGTESSSVEGNADLPVCTSSTPMFSVGGTSGAIVPPLLNIGSAGRTVLPQFIPIPILHAKGMTPDTQFVYMSS